MKKNTLKLLLMTFVILSSYNINHTLAATSDDFVTVWKTDNPGSSDNKTITINTVFGTSYNFNIDWENDGVFDTFGATNTISHTYAATGTYEVRISGLYPAIKMYDNTDRKKLIGIKQWGTNAWATMNKAFSSLQDLNISATDTPNLSGVTDMSYMFADITGNITGNFSNWDTSKVTSTYSMFSGASSFNQDIGGWNMASNTNMIGMFAEATQFNNGTNTVMNWNTSNVNSMGAMFNDATQFNRPIGMWDTSKVTDMYNMFSGASSFNQDIGGWSMASNTNMDSMFVRATQFNNGTNTVMNWNTSNVTNMASMFYDATQFNRPIGMWDTSKVTNMFYIFYKATSFNQDIGGWNTSKVVNMNGTLSNATQFNKPIGMWDTSNVTNMASMFYRATSFNQNIENWNLNKVNNFSDIFSNSGLSTANYDKFLTSLASNTVTTTKPLGASGIKYCAFTAKTKLTNAPYNWTITDGGASSTCPVYIYTSITGTSTILSETGSSAFWIGLTSAPTTSVILNITSSNIAEATVSTGTLTFTNANWFTPQLVTINGVQDNVIDGDKGYKINITVDAISNSLYIGATSSIAATTTDSGVTPSVIYSGGGGGGGGGGGYVYIPPVVVSTSSGSINNVATNTKNIFNNVISSSDIVKACSVIKSKKMRLGMRSSYKGDDVLALQDFLKNKGYLTVATTTKIFGPMTSTALKKFQKDNSLLKTGIVGSLTLKAIKSKCK